MRNRRLTMALHGRRIRIKYFSGALMSLAKRRLVGRGARNALLLVAVSFSAAAQKAPEKGGSKAPAAAIWSDPGDIKSKDLFTGPGGKDHGPVLPLRFVKEDLDGHNPKFDAE